MSTNVSNLDKILSFLRDKSSCDQSFNVIFQCKDGQIRIQSLILIAASNFWKNLLLDNPDNFCEIFYFPTIITYNVLYTDRTVFPHIPFRLVSNYPPSCH